MGPFLMSLHLEFASEAPLETGMRACLWLRTAIRVLHQIAHSDFAVRPENRNDYLDGADVYRFVRESVDWGAILGDGAFSFSIKVRLSHVKKRPLGRSRREEYGRFRESRYQESFLTESLVQVRAKDAICDALRDAGFDKPPRPETHASADLPLFIVVHGCSITVYRDMAGTSLHKRGYRSSIPLHVSSLNECVSAGMSYIAGLKPDGSFENGSTHSAPIDSVEELTIIDPMCGSATLLIEAALCIKQVAVGLFRSQFAFQRWDDFDAQIFSKIVTEAREIARTCEHKTFTLIGNDINREAVSLARQGIRNAGLSDDIQVYNEHIRDFAIPRSPTLVLSNPPWGMRLGEEKEAWLDMGDFLRQFCAGSTAVLLSGDSGLTKGLRMRARRKYPVRIGNVDTRVLLYDVLTYEQVVEIKLETAVIAYSANMNGPAIVVVPIKRTGHFKKKLSYGKATGGQYSSGCGFAPVVVIAHVQQFGNMCGIAVVVDSTHELAWPDWPFWSGSRQITQLPDLREMNKLSPIDSRNLEPLMASLARRGPDFQTIENLHLGCGTRIALLGAVLSLRGARPVLQPACDGENSLLFNGEVYDHVTDDISGFGTEDLCDTTVLLRQLAATQGDGEKILKFLDGIRGPWSIIYWHNNTKRLYFGRDVLGRDPC